MQQRKQIFRATLNSISRISTGGSSRVAPWRELHVFSQILAIIAIQVALEGNTVTAPGILEHVMIGIELLATVISVMLVMKITRAQSALARSA